MQLLAFKINQYLSFHKKAIDNDSCCFCHKEIKRISLFECLFPHLCPGGSRSECVCMWRPGWQDRQQACHWRVIWTQPQGIKTSTRAEASEGINKFKCLSLTSFLKVNTSNSIYNITDKDILWTYFPTCWNLLHNIGSRWTNYPSPPFCCVTFLVLPFPSHFLELSFNTF